LNSRCSSGIAALHTRSARVPRTGSSTRPAGRCHHPGKYQACSPHQCFWPAWLAPPGAEPCLAPKWAARSATLTAGHELGSDCAGAVVSHLGRGVSFVAGLPQFLAAVHHLPQQAAAHSGAAEAVWEGQVLVVRGGAVGVGGALQAGRQAGRQAGEGRAGSGSTGVMDRHTCAGRRGSLG